MFVYESQCTEERIKDFKGEDTTDVPSTTIEKKTKDHPMMSSSFPSLLFGYVVIALADFPSYPSDSFL